MNFSNELTISICFSFLSYFFDLQNESNVENLERVNMGERIRDMIKVDSVLVLFLEDSASLAFVNLK